MGIHDRLLVLGQLSNIRVNDIEWSLCKKSNKFLYVFEESVEKYSEKKHNFAQ